MERRRQGIVDTIDKFFIKTFPSNLKAKTTAEKIKLLNDENKKNPFIDFKMQGEVQSYDLLQNEKYGRLDELKSVLDQKVANNSIKNMSTSTNNRI